jgi:DNA-binding transcriptional LysR family regulator
MTLEQLQALVAVGRAGSLAEAARRTKIPRTTLQRRIQELEAHLGVALVHRMTHGVVLTAAGQKLVEKGSSLLEAFDGLGASVREEHENQGTLRVNYPCGIHPLVLTAAARMLMTALPQVRFQALVGPQPRVGPQPDPNGADVSLHFGSPPPGPFVARAIARLPLRLFAGRAYPRPLPETPEALEDHDLLFWSADQAPPVLPLLAGGTLPVRPRLITPDLHFLHWAAREGIGLAWAIDGGVQEPAGVEPLRQVLPDQVGGTVPLWLVLPEATRDAPRIQEAIQYLVALAGTPP